MIFVTIGSVFPFDRLVRAMDDWAAARPPEVADEEILAQIGDGTYEPPHLTWIRRLDRVEYGAAVVRARLIVAHAGVGSMVSAREQTTPIVVLPRREHLREHTSDHQMETAGWLRGKAGVYVADDETELAVRIAEATANTGTPGEVVAATADPAFIARIRAFVLEDGG